MPWLERARREPLLHFFVIGAALFAVDAWRGSRDDAAPRAVASLPSNPRPTGPIVVSALVRTRLAEGWQGSSGAPPTAAELDALVDHWINEEVLFREGMARGLDRDDERIRARVASKMGFVVDAQIILAEPSEAELRAFFAAHAERWASGTRVDFTHVFLKSEGTARGAKDDARAQELLGRLTAGADPNGLGDVFSGGRRYRGRQLADLAVAFGDTFIDGLDAQPVGAWAVRRSRFGWHVVRVDRRAAALTADFEAARLDVRQAWHDEKRAEAFTAATDALRARWQIVRE